LSSGNVVVIVTIKLLTGTNNLYSMLYTDNGSLATQRPPNDCNNLSYLTLFSPSQSNIIITCNWRLQSWTKSADVDVVLNLRNCNLTLTLTCKQCKNNVMSHIVIRLANKAPVDASAYKW